MLYERISKETLRLQQQMETIQKSLENFDLPEGKFICSRNGRYSKWYHSNGTSITYIPKSNRALAEKFAIKNYLSCVLDDLSHEKKALDFYLRHHRPYSDNAEQLLTKNPGYAELLASHFTSFSQEITDWINAPYEQNCKNPEHLLHKTASGHLVRSKSEAMIDSYLYTNRIPFRYECALYLGNTLLYPDFTIRHPDTGELYYWEHFGLMDDPSYCKTVTNKLQCYIGHGIIPSIQLITTYETQSNPLSTELIYKTIEHYFL